MVEDTVEDTRRSFSPVVDPVGASSSPFPRTERPIKGKTAVATVTSSNQKLGDLKFNLKYKS